MAINKTQFPLLSTIETPAQLRQLEENKLIPLAAELRQFLLAALNECGGHFAANLGTVELAIALHYVFNTPNDRLIWDVGHQAYPHKILTGRRDQLTTIRQTHGLAPFPARSESPYDAFGVGHSSTSISAALGMAIGENKAVATDPHSPSGHPLPQSGRGNKAVAIIGDGAMTAGMAFEAMNHAGDLKANLLVILNDNNMSISHNVGGLSNYVARVLSGKLYSTIREGGKKVLSAMPTVWELARRTEEHVKGMLIPGTLFEELGFNYIGPIDGHDLPTLIATLRNISELKGPQFLHVITKKGKGHAPAEADPIGYHAVSPGFLTAKAAAQEGAQPCGTVTSSQGGTQPCAPTVTPAPSTVIPAHAGIQANPPTYSQIFGDWICDMAAQDTRLVGLTPAMREGSGLVRFSERYPDRYFDVGIAEQHCVTVAAGMACEGLKPIVTIYSTFLQRAYDQLIHDVALQNLPVLFAIDRGGLVGGDGATHNGNFDLSYLRCIPNMIVMAPSDENECRQMLYTGFLQNGPCAVRYPRGTGPGTPIQAEMQAIPLGKAEIRRQGQHIALLAFGNMLAPALQATEQLNATVVNMRFIKPLDEALIQQIAKQHSLIVTIEENVVMGGAGSAVGECLHRLALEDPMSHTPKLLQLGLPDTFLSHGNPKELLANCGLDAKGILAAVKKYWLENLQHRVQKESIS